MLFLGRWSYVGLAILMSTLVVTGFWASYLGPLARLEVPPVPGVIHLHGAIFLGWMLLLVAQVTLVATGHTRAHMKVGRWGIGYGLLVLVVGLVASFAAPALDLAAGESGLDQAAGFLLLAVVDGLLFGGFFLSAVYYRSRPSIHKRLMVLATIALLLAPAARLVGFPPVVPVAALSLWLSPLALAMGLDLWIHRRIHPTYIVGAAVLLLAYTRIFAMDSEAWLRVGRSIMTALTQG